MKNLARHISKTAPVPQTKKAKETQVKNSAGGFVFKADDWNLLQRFLILGTEGGTYYISEKKLTTDNAKVVERCLSEDYMKTIVTIQSISAQGRAVKNDPAILALAIAAASDKPEIRQAAFSAMPQVCRIPTHLFHFVTFYEELVGCNSRLRKAISKWYQDRQPKKLMYQTIKYQSRDGWSNRDLLRLAHPKPKSLFYEQLFGYIVKDKKEIANFKTDFPNYIYGFEAAKENKDNKKSLVKLIQDFELSWEMLPTEALQYPEVWETLIPNLPVEALIRNLAKMTSIGLLAPGADANKKVLQKLNDNDYILASKIHPLKVLVGLKTYSLGHGIKGNLTWRPVQKIVDSLDDVFYAAFGSIQPTGKKLLFGLDVSGSMGMSMAHLPITYAEGTAVLAMVQARVEDDYEIMGFETQFSKLAITPKMTLKEACRQTQQHNFGGTDCSLPWIFARKHKMKLDGVIIMTDNETWAGTSHPFQEAQAYRKEFGPAKQVVVGMAANPFTIADPSDKLSLDVVGFDTATPNVISEFIRG